MMIEFFCPNEHKIRCAEEMVGRPAKCPKCGVSFRVPNLDELSLGASASADADEQAGNAAATAPPAARGPQEGPSPAAEVLERQIEFLCPNGHHLHGPASLQGRAGECPECGSRFRIPVVDEPEAPHEPLPEPQSEPQSADEADIPLEEETALDPHVRSAQVSAGGTAEPPAFLQVHDEPLLAEASDPGAAPGAVLGLSSEGDSGTHEHPLAALFAELWAARDESSRVEVHLETGSILVPDGYLKSRSMHGYAVLVTKDPDGRWTMTVVPWNSVSKIILRALKEVPGDVVR